MRHDTGSMQKSFLSLWSPGRMESLKFIYQDSKGHITARVLLNISETDKYIQGICQNKKELRTFLKSRVLEYVSDEAVIENRLRHHQSLHPSPIGPSLSRRFKREINALGKPEVCFTGFKEESKSILSKLASDNGMLVRTEVTKNISYLCCGNNAGPKKIEKARNQGVVALDEEQFRVLLDTGEIPDHD